MRRINNERESGRKFFVQYIFSLYIVDVILGDGGGGGGDVS